MKWQFILLVGTIVLLLKIIAEICKEFVYMNGASNPSSDIYDLILHYSNKCKNEKSFVGRPRP